MRVFGVTEGGVTAVWGETTTSTTVKIHNVTHRCCSLAFRKWHGETQQLLIFLYLREVCPLPHPCVWCFVFHSSLFLPSPTFAALKAVRISPPMGVSVSASNPNKGNLKEQEPSDKNNKIMTIIGKQPSIDHGIRRKAANRPQHVFGSSKNTWQTATS